MSNIILIKNINIVNLKTHIFIVGYEFVMTENNRQSGNYLHLSLQERVAELLH